MTDETHRPPPGLGRAGARLWRVMTSTYRFDTAETLILFELCRVARRLDEIRAEIDRGPLSVPGSRGQVIVHPGLAEERQLRDQLARLVRQLDLPAEAADGGNVTTIASRLGGRGAQARWYGRRVEGA